MKLVFFDYSFHLVQESLSYLRDFTTEEARWDLRNSLDTVSEIASCVVCDELTQKDLRMAASHAMVLSYRLAYSAKVWFDETRAYHSIVLFGFAERLQEASGMSPTSAYLVNEREWQQLNADKFCDTVDDH